MLHHEIFEKLTLREICKCIRAKPTYQFDWLYNVLVHNIP